MVSGRLRMHDREQIAKDMIEWAKLDTSTNLNGFCATREPPMAPSKVTLWAKEDDFFRQAYEATKAIIGMRRERNLSNGSLHTKAYDLNAKVYDHFLKEEWKETVKYESELNKPVEDASKAFMEQQFKEVVDHFKSKSASLDKPILQNEDNQTNNVK